MYEALEKAKEEGATLNYWNEDNPRCPHCGEAYDIQENEDWGLHDPSLDEHEIECPSCEQEFKVGATVSITYTTRDADDEDA